MLCSFPSMCIPAQDFYKPRNQFADTLIICHYKCLSQAGRGVFPVLEDWAGLDREELTSGQFCKEWMAVGFKVPQI